MNENASNTIKPGLFGKIVPADSRRMDFDFYNEQILYLHKRPDLLFIGDSITQLWDLSAYFGSNQYIVNRGIGGDDSTYLAKRFQADAVQLNPEKIILMIGTNDIMKTNDDLWWRTKGEEEETVLNEFKNNILEIIKECDAAKIELIVCSVIPSDIAPPFDKEMRWRMTDKMNAFLRESGKQYIDCHHALTDDGKTLIHGLSPDGIHVNAKGYEIMAGVLKETLHLL